MDAGQAVAVLGGGAWGAAFGNAIAAPHCPVRFWNRTPARAVAAAAAAAQNSPHTCAVDSVQEAVAAAGLVVVAVSSGGFVQLLRQLDAVRAPVLWLTKGFDAASSMPLCDAAAAALPQQPHLGAISGPSFAQEVARGLPTALTLALRDAALADRLRTALHRPHLRFYPSSDLTGVCIAGAVKNIIAIAAGISDGLHLGENARAALVARGLAEMGALARALGGQRETLLGLAGVGDVLLTCCSDLSRNRRLGLALAAGAPPPQETCEGQSAAAVAVTLAAAHGVEVPVLSSVAAVLSGACTPAEAAAQLLRRPPR